MKIAEARRKGKGLKVQDWQIDSDGDPQAQGVAESIVTWARDILASCRRPYGIDHFDLTLAFRSATGSRVKSLAFDRLRPIDLYQEALPERIANSISRECAGPRGARLWVSAALFSWGEAAHLALPNRALANQVLANGAG
jgi:hypothetical protein